MSFAIDVNILKLFATFRTCAFYPKTMDSGAFTAPLHRRFPLGGIWSLMPIWRLCFVTTV